MSASGTRLRTRPRVGACPVGSLSSMRARYRSMPREQAPRGAAGSGNEVPARLERERERRHTGRVDHLGRQAGRAYVQLTQGQTKNGMINSATMFATLIIGLIAGPAVSLNGSPTVSPVTDAACASEPLPPNDPSSISFLALSHAPPADVMAIARKSPVTIVPVRSPPSMRALMIPTTTGNA